MEDELIIAEDLRMCLQERGFEVVEIVSIREQIVERCRETLPDLVLMDICLQGEFEGFRAARTIKAEYGIPVIYLSACLENLFPRGVSCQESAPCVKKPFSEEELCAVIETALKNHGRNS